MSAKPRTSKPAASALPWRPYHAEALTDAQIKQVLSGSAGEYFPRALMQVLEGQLTALVMDMGSEVPGAAPAFRRMIEFYEGLKTMLEAPPATQ